jgi:hypothetical protein
VLLVDLERGKPPNRCFTGAGIAPAADAPQQIRDGLAFPRREAGGPSRPARAGVTQTRRPKTGYATTPREPQSGTEGRETTLSVELDIQPSIEEVRQYLDRFGEAGTV